MKLRNMGIWAAIPLAIVCIGACGSDGGLKTPTQVLSIPVASTPASATSSSIAPVVPPAPIDAAPTTTAPPPAPVKTTHAVVAVPKTTTHAAAAPPPPPAPPSETDYANCKALNAVYPHGVGRAGAVDQTSGSAPVTDFYVDTALYNANSSHDGDGDGIACEKR